MAIAFLFEDEASFARMVRLIAAMHEMRFVDSLGTASAILDSHAVPFIAGRLNRPGTAALRELLAPQWQALPGRAPEDLQLVPVEGATPLAG